MDEGPAKAARIRRELLPGLCGIAQEAGIRDEVNLVCTRWGTIELTIQNRTTSKMLPLFTPAEIADDSYKGLFLPRVTKLLGELR